MTEYVVKVIQVATIDVEADSIMEAENKAEMKVSKDQRCCDLYYETKTCHAETREEYDKWR